ncbi:MAG: thioredoxin domain-containing protein, partial [Actinomycetes bacterium]
FLTPDGVPFYGGTYFPDKARYGMPAFSEVLSQIAGLWETRRSEILEAGAGLTATLRQEHASGMSPGRVTAAAGTLDAATRSLLRSFDAVNGGWGGAPKFPQPTVLELVLRRYQATGDERLLALVTTTLDAMARGGIYDQLGGGFHRYATDAVWLVPHFEKMLYDNAQLAGLYLHAWQVTGDESYRRIVTETLDYVAREMLDAGGGFYSAQDADSEGEEGAFFVWTPAEIRAVADRVCDDPVGDAELFMAAFGVTPGGNFEGKSILFAARPQAEIARLNGMAVAEVESRLENLRTALFARREQRVKPALDDKVLAGWNGLMLTAFAAAARVLDRDDYLSIARRNAELVLSQMRDRGGRMLRTWKGGRAKLNGYLEDYAHYAGGLLELYQATFEPRWFHAARALGDAILEHFVDPAGGFFDTSDDHEKLLLRPKGIQDGAVPSGGAMAATVLLRLAEYTGEGRYADAAEGALAPLQAAMARAPLALAHWLAALDFMFAPPQGLAIVGADRGPLLDVARARYRPNLVVAAGPSAEDHAIALLEGREALGGRATAYLCQRFSCERPVSSPEDLAALLDQ